MDTVKAQITKFDLKSLGQRLKNEPIWHHRKRNSLVLFKGEGRHVYLIGMHELTLIPDHRTPCAVSIHVLEGKIRLLQASSLVVLRANELATVEADTQYGVEAEEESLFVLEYFTSDIKHKIKGEADDYFDNWV